MNCVDADLFVQNNNNNNNKRVILTKGLRPNLLGLLLSVIA